MDAGDQDLEHQGRVKACGLRIVADDLSGAGDCAASFTATVRPLPLFLDALLVRGDQFALDADSRGLDAEGASQRWNEVALQHFRDAPAHSILFKKIDSTLRGHVAREIAAVLEAVPEIRTVVISPAFPAQGRTFVDGQLRVNGVSTGAAFTTLHDQLVGMLGGRCDIVPLGLAAVRNRRVDVFRNSRSKPAVVIADAVEEADLAALAMLRSEETECALWVGSAGLARALARNPPRRWPPEALAAPALVVVGSFSTVARTQITAFARERAPCVIPVKPQASAAEMTRAAADASRLLARGADVLVHLAFGDVPVLSGVRSHVTALARALMPAALECGTLVLTGGDTARAMLGALGIDALHIEGELEPGVPVSAPLRETGARVVLKAGGFGDNEIFVRITRSLARMPNALPSP